MTDLKDMSIDELRHCIGAIQSKHNPHEAFDELVRRYLELEAKHAECEHVANEWADVATNGLQWLKNIQDNVSTVDEALAALNGDIIHCQRVSGSSYMNKGEGK